jgi:Beta-glucan synthesis-associated protein SKN1/KRE6/Sbg1
MFMLSQNDQNTLMLILYFFSFLQVAPGVLKNRPQTGSAPLTKSIISPTGHTEFVPQTWYKGLEMWGNTSINPFFYGTYLAETKPNEPVTRTIKQAFQADAVGVAHQLSPMHFQKPHTFRLEWQPGRGGRLDWYIRVPASGNTSSSGDKNDGFQHLFALNDASLKDLMGSQIPIEPMAILFNVAVSSTWGFPFDSPDWCPKCYDCDDPKCACAFYPGFCQMIRSNRTAMYIDFVRVYQSSKPDAHVGANHTLGCDPPGYPTKEWIHGHSYRYMRNPPFSYEDKHPLRPIQTGGGSCDSDRDCGGDIRKPNLTAVYEQQQAASGSGRDLGHDNTDPTLIGRGQCVQRMTHGMFSLTSDLGSVCVCNAGYTGPYCLALRHFDDTPSAYKIRTSTSPFRRMHYFIVPNDLFAIGIVLLTLLWALLVVRIRDQKRERSTKLLFEDNSVDRRNAVGNANATSVGYAAIR